MFLATYWQFRVSLLFKPVLSHSLGRWCNFPQAFPHHAPSAYTLLFDLSSTGLSQGEKLLLNFIFDARVRTLRQVSVKFSGL